MRATLDGRQVDPRLRGLQGRALFAYLVLNRTRSASRDLLTDALWPGALPSDPAAALRTQLSRLRKAVGGEVLSRGSEIRLALPEDAWIDIEQARAGLSEAEAALNEERWPDALASARGSLKLTRHGFLPGLNVGWADELRHELEEMGFRAHECTAEAGVAIGGPAEIADAERSARAMIEHAPTRESGHMLLMRALVARGRRAEALDAYEQLRQRLRGVLGIEPSPQLKALEAELRAEGGELAPAVSAAPTPIAGAPAAPAAPHRSPLPAWLTSDELGSFVGRGAELRQLREQWIRVRSGDRRLTLIRGEPGIGKTRLAVEFALAAQRGRARILYGRCDEDAIVPFQPFVESMRHYLRSRPIETLNDSLVEHARELAPLVPEFEPRLPRDARPVRRQETDRYRLFEAMDAMLDAASSLTPTLLVLDDLHWADRDTLLLLRHLIRSPSRSPLFIIGTYRASEPGEDVLEALADLGRDRLYDRISLDGFDQHETASMVSLLVGRDLPEDFARSLGEDMGGNPFAIHAMVRHLLESGHLGADGQPLPSGPSLYAAGLPEDLEELLGQRISRLDEPTRRVLSAAAVIGSEFDADLVGSVAELNIFETIDALEQAGLAGLVTADAAKPGGYHFAHALVRQSLYSGLPSRLRSRLHRNAAESLVGTPEAEKRPSEVARHYLAAGGEGVAEAAAYSITAAELAEEVHAYSSAVGHYRSALDALEAVGDATTAATTTKISRRQLLRALGNAQRRAGEVESARRSFLRLARAARKSGDSEALAQAALGFGGPSSASWGQRDHAAISLLIEVLQYPPEDLELRSRIIARLAQAMHFSDEPVVEAEGEEVEAMSLEAVELARRSGSPSALTGALAARIYVSFGPESLEERIRLLDEMRQTMRQSGGRELLGQEQSWRIGVLLERGRVDEAEAEIERQGLVAEQSRRPAAQIYNRIFRVSQAHLRGNFAEGERLIEEAESFGERAGYPDVVQLLGSQRFYAQLMAGRAGESEALIEGLVSRYPGTASWRSALLHVYCQQDRLEEARGQLAAMIAAGLPPRDAADSWLPATAAVCIACAQLGEAEIAASVYAALEPYAERIIISGIFAVCWGPGHRYLGLAASAMEDWEAAERHFEAAVEISARTGAPHWLAEARFDLATALRQRAGSGDLERAGQLLEEVTASARDLGLADLLQRAESTQAAV